MRPKYLCAIASRYPTNSYPMSLENSGLLPKFARAASSGVLVLHVDIVLRNVLGILNSF
jgi:hypothetical protein